MVLREDEKGIKQRLKFLFNKGCVNVKIAGIGITVLTALLVIVICIFKDKKINYKLDDITSLVSIGDNGDKNDIKNNNDIKLSEPEATEPQEENIYNSEALDSSDSGETNTENLTESDSDSEQVVNSNSADSSKTIPNSSESSDNTINQTSGTENISNNSVSNVPTDKNVSTSTQTNENTSNNSIKDKEIIVENTEDKEISNESNNTVNTEEGSNNSSSNNSTTNSNSNSTTTNTTTNTSKPSSYVGNATRTSLQDGSTYMLRNLSSGSYMEAADGDIYDGANVQQWKTTISKDYNTWIIKSAGSGYYNIYSRGGDGKTYALDVKNGKSSAGTNVIISKQSTANSQLFKLEKNSDGTYTIYTKASGDKYCVEVVLGSKSSGANIRQGTYIGASYQKWELILIQ